MHANTDSPWFWFLLFGAVAMAGLAVIGPKHVQREERRVRMQGAREKRDRVEAPQLDEVSADEVQDDAAELEPRATVRPLMLFLAAALLIGATIAALRSRRSTNPTESAA